MNRSTTTTGTADPGGQETGRKDGGRGEAGPSAPHPAMVSYAQNLEDVLLHRTLSHIEKGFYIDAGAQDPVRESVTKFFYEQGWRGINIEPVAHWFERLKADRPEDINLQIALGSRPGTLPLFEITGTGLSTTVPGIAAQHRKAGYDPKVEGSINVDTLDAVCARHMVETVHFLKVDVEGAEADVLQGLALDRLRPWIILIESTLPNSQETTHHQWEHLLTGRGYCFAWFDGLNRYYVADEHAELKQAFGVQPNIFDHFVRHAEAEAGRRAAALDRDLRATREERDALLAERNQKASEVARLRMEMDRIVKDGDRLAEDYERLTEKLAWARCWERIIEEQKAFLDHSVALAQTLELTSARFQDFEASRMADAGPQAKIAGLERTITLLKAEITALRHSTSWRLTAPIRLAKTSYLDLRGTVIPSRRGSLDMRARLNELARRAAEQPMLRRIAVNLLNRHPSLKRRLTAYLTASPSSSTPTFPATRQSSLAPPLSGTDTSDAQRQAWQALSRALAGKEQP